MAITRRMNGTLGDLGPMDPGGMALTPPTDPGGLALPQPGPMDPGGMALPAPGPAMPQAPQAPQWQNPNFGEGYNPFAPRLSWNNGQTFLNEHGNQRLLQGNEIADAQRYVTDHFNQFGQFGGNTWGSGNAAVDPYMGQIPFPAGRGPAFGEGPPGGKQGPFLPGPPQDGSWSPIPSVPGFDARLYQPGPWQTMGGSIPAAASAAGQFTSGGLVPGAMRGAFGGAFGLFGGRRGAGAMRGGTLGNLAPTGSSYGVEQDPTLLR